MNTILLLTTFFQSTIQMQSLNINYSVQFQNESIHHVTIKIFDRNPAPFWKFWSQKPQLLAYMDVYLEVDCVRVDGFGAQDERHNRLIGVKEPPLLDVYASQDIHDLMLSNVESFAIKNNQRKVIVDTHSNLDAYNLQLKRNGYVPNGKKCKENRAWIEVEKCLVC